MKVLFVYPEYPVTFWSFKYSLKFISKKASLPPLGLITVAAMTPDSWEKKLVDLNAEKLDERILKDYDFCFISAMAVQRKSAREVISLCKKHGVKIVAGGPLFTTEPEKFDDVDYLVLNEAEITLKEFLHDLEHGKPKHIYATAEWADIKTTPPPQWDLLNKKYYASMSLQFSRGCPFNCEFCDIPFLYGRMPRTKTAEQMVRELESLYQWGWRGDLFFVDDNFIGNKRVLKKEVLPAMVEWMRKRNYPFSIITEASLNLVDDEELMDLMINAGFNRVFVGIETPNEDSLKEANKFANLRRNLLESVRILHEHGFIVHSGFILGFDSDKPSIFDLMIRFIQNSAITVAMVGLLNAPRGSKLYEKLKLQKRLLGDITGDNTDFSTNIIPKMGLDTLVAGYKKVVSTIYSPAEYYKRVKKFLTEYKLPRRELVDVNWTNIKAFLKSLFVLGIKDRGRKYYWKLLLWTIFKRPKYLPITVTLYIYGYHFRRIFIDDPKKLAPSH